MSMSANVSIAVGTGMGSLRRWGTCCTEGFFCRRRVTWIPSESALRWRGRFTEPIDGVDDAVVEVEAFLVCFDDRPEKVDPTELDVFEASEDARDRVRSNVDVAGDEYAEKWLPVTYVLTARSEIFES